jgi:hypothetical protein
MGLQLSRAMIARLPKEIWPISSALVEATADGSPES